VIDVISKTDCPKDGVCTFEVIKNKSAEIKNDKFGNPYLEVFESEKTLLKFEYKRNPIENTQDSNYSEIIYVEINPNSDSITTNTSLNEENTIIYGRICFCRGQTGYYPISQGQLNISKTDTDTYLLNLDFKCTAVPQIIKSISENFKL